MIKLFTLSFLVFFNTASQNVSSNTQNSFMIACPNQKGFTVANKPGLVFGINGPINSTQCVRI
ncbi:hypothetical protein ACV07N_06485 [Roseivirga echinicomitans]